MPGDRLPAKDIDTCNYVNEGSRDTGIKSVNPSVCQKGVMALSHIRVCLVLNNVLGLVNL